MDIAAGIVAAREADGPVATVAIEAMTFIAPVLLQDLISVYARIERVGRTSIGIRIEVIASRSRGKQEVKVTEGLFTFVALDEGHRPRAVKRGVAEAHRAIPAKIVWVLNRICSVTANVPSSFRPRKRVCQPWEQWST